MVKNILIPEKIGAFNLFTQRTVALQITKTAIYAACITAKGSKKIIEKVIMQPLEHDDALNQQEQIINALKKIASQLPKNAEITALLSSEQIVYKEITTPLMSIEKIKLIVPFEIEKQLPFSLTDASVDCVITQKDTSTNQAAVIVVAVKKDILEQFLQLFHTAGIVVNRVSSDMIELFALFKAIPEYATKTEPLVLIESAANTTRLALIVKGQLVAVRIIPSGISNSFSTTNQETSHQQPSSFEPQSTPANNQPSRELLMTLESFKSRLPVGATLERIVLCGEGADVNGLCAQLTQQTSYVCDTLVTQTILQHHAISTVPKNFANMFTIVVAAALRYPLTQTFNLDHEAEEAAATKTINYQILAMIILISTLLITLITITWLTNKSLEKEYKASEQQAIATIQDKFGFDKSIKGNLTSLVARARADLENQGKIWSSLSPENRSSVLVYMQEIFSRLDREALGLQMQRLTINTDNDTMTLEGRVKDFEALRLLEEELRRSKMVKDVSKLQELRFNAKITLEKM